MRSGICFEGGDELRLGSRPPKLQRSLGDTQLDVDVAGLNGERFVLRGIIVDLQHHSIVEGQAEPRRGLHLVGHDVVEQ